MAKRRPYRQSVSLRPAVFERIREWCEDNDMPVAAAVEHFITGGLDALEVPQLDPTEARLRIDRRRLGKPSPRSRRTGDGIGGSWTF